MGSTQRVRHTAAAFVPLVVALMGSACGGAQAVETPSAESTVRPPRARYGNLNPRAYTATSQDLNADGTPDQFVYRGGPGGGFTSRDLDFDGRVDLFEYVDSQGQVVEQELQLDFDEAIDLVRVYSGGRLVRKEFATGFDSVPSMFKFYDAAGNLLRVERDTNGDGVVDFFGYYEGPHLARVGVDLDGDGRPDDVQAYD